MNRRLVFLFAFGGFVVAVDGTLVIGLLRQVASSLAMKPAVAGQAVTVFAATYSVATPIVVRLSRRLGTRVQIAGALALFGLANIATGVALNLTMLLIARALAGASAGVFMATASLASARSATSSKRGRALSVVVGGASIATAVGVPIGTLLGGLVNWRWVFFAVAVLTTAATVLMLRNFPTKLAHGQVPTRRAERSNGLLLMLLTTLLWAIGSFTFFTYVSVVLHRTAAVDAPGLAVIFLAFGIAGLAGAALGGWLIDTRGTSITLKVALGLVVVSLASLAALATPSSRFVLPSVFAMIAYGIGTWAVTPAQQHRLLAYGGDHGLLLSLNASALYAGVAIGSAIGGAVLAGTSDVAVLCLVAAAIMLAALVLATASTRRDLTSPAREPMSTSCSVYAPGASEQPCPGPLDERGRASEV